MSNTTVFNYAYGFGAPMDALPMS